MKLVMPELVIGDKKARLAIIQGGMSIGISGPGLVGAVANEGGIGTLGSAGSGINEPGFRKNPKRPHIEGMRKMIINARKKTKGIIGNNIMVALSNYADMVKVSIDERVDIIFSGGGLPLDLPGLAGDNVYTKLVPIVSSGRGARVICKRWANHHERLPDAVVVEGPKAGGHLGFKPEELDDPAYALEKLILEVLAEVKPFEDKYGVSIPVIAAGGIYTGADIAKFLRMGAAGVQLGTRFVTTHECDASIEFKQTYIDATEDDLVIIKSPVGMPGRALRNQFLDDVVAGIRKPYRCPYHCIKTCDYKESPYCIFFALMHAQRGNLKHGFAFAGTNAYRATEIISVHELMETLVREYNEAEEALS